LTGGGSIVPNVEDSISSGDVLANFYLVDGVFGSKASPKLINIWLNTTRGSEEGAGLQPDQLVDPLEMNAQKVVKQF
jgi:hypothetical protein